MAQNVTIAGATYNDVPSIVVPKSSSGDAIFVDPTPTTAETSDVVNGKSFFLANGTLATGSAIIPKPATALPLESGTATVGTSVKYAREDHRHPTDTSRASTTDLTNLANAFKAFTITLGVNSWSNNTQIITNNNFVATGYAYIVCASVENLSEYNSCAIYADNVTVNGQITFYCDSVPESDLIVAIVRILGS